MDERRRSLWGLGKLFLLGLLLTVATGCGTTGTGGGSSAAPTSSGGGGSSSPVSVELPAISAPTSIATGMTAVTGASSSVNVDPNILPAFSSATKLQALQQSGPDNMERINTTLDFVLSVFCGMSCPAKTGTTTCLFVNCSGIPVKVDFASHSFTAPFSANNTNQTNLTTRTCVADTNTAISDTTALCARVWTPGQQRFIGAFTTRPTSTDKGAGWFVAIDPTDSTNQFGAIYDKSAATAAKTDAPFSYVEFFTTIGGIIENSHYFASETKVSSDTLVNFRSHSLGPNESASSAVKYTARWLDKWYGNLTQGSETGTGVCTTLAGVETTGCSSTLTSPALPDFLNLAVSADHQYPSTAIYPADPTF
ncbi:MAG: hypothetical protein HY543_02145 [Deltaproteobacteria bacterium]|nr:hypothetical protein [Deltaproteobacteria bacterium]